MSTIDILFLDLELKIGQAHVCLVLSFLKSVHRLMESTMQGTCHQAVRSLRAHCHAMGSLADISVRRAGSV
ncbi:hypothetical protein [Noviherbaspirillum sp.]|uniref:hypothetical protein n=1 Tax=Noviherbaspirillum sp. TaxID=1926288 RepID=UPI002B463E79|nr:hypothetical protein [Noviherbaspirillum sp.]HJV80427.1 hypothetical protein [Noviherbaspirillum sp.]